MKNVRLIELMLFVACCGAGIRVAFLLNQLYLAWGT